MQALADIKGILQPKRKCGIGHTPFQYDNLLRSRLEMMQSLLTFYTDINKGRSWTASSELAAAAFGKGKRTARNIRRWMHSFIGDRENLPYNLYGMWNILLLQKGELAHDILLHLQSKGKTVKAADIIEYLQEPQVQTKHGLKKTISLATAKLWMHVMGYRFTKAPHGQYVDGHERNNVVEYRQTIFLPTIAELQLNMRIWNDGVAELTDSLQEGHCPIVVWYHDESTFYAHNRRMVYWVHTSEKAVPRAKGEGASLMVADFVSADFGWLCSPDKEESARVLFKAGKNREGYFTNDDILKQTTNTMNILEKHYPEYDHIFCFDNAKTHLKRDEDALSARRLPKFPTAENQPVFGVERNIRGLDGKPVYGPNGKILKEKVRMADARLHNGDPQSLYFEEGHAKAGDFKGMQVILEEHGYTDLDYKKLRAECPKFQCKPGETRCCCCRILYNKPDFRDVGSHLEKLCKTHGFRVVFLPKFHCELNFIEQCWCHAKRHYRNLPPSSTEDVLVANVQLSLESVPLDVMRRLAQWSAQLQRTKNYSHKSGTRTAH